LGRKLRRKSKAISALRAGEPCALGRGNSGVFFDNFWRIAYFVSIYIRKKIGGFCHEKKQKN
jgi:hypothetical protein